jgi:hypothetical protein
MIRRVRAGAAQKSWLKLLLGTRLTDFSQANSFMTGCPLPSAVA